MFEHCLEILKKEQKWDAYLKFLEDLYQEGKSFVLMMKSVAFQSR
jgi:hypothetical protein